MESDSVDERNQCRNLNTPMKSKHPKRKLGSKAPKIRVSPNSSEAEFSHRYHEERKRKTDKAQALRKKLQSTLDALMHTFPSDAIREAQQLLTLGRKSLSKMIELKHDLKYSHDLKDEITIDAEYWFCRHTERMVLQLCKLAESGRYYPVASTWRAAANLAIAIHDLALTNRVENLQRIARTAFTIPSLRTKSESFTYDLKEIVDNTQLSTSCAIDVASKVQINLWPTRIVLDLLVKFTNLKAHVKVEEESFNLDKSPKDSFEGYLQQNYSSEEVKWRMLCRELPLIEYSTRDKWWKKVIKPNINEQTLDLLRTSKGGMTFYKAFEKSGTAKKKGDGSKDSSILDKLKKRCKQVMDAKSLYKKQQPRIKIVRLQENRSIETNHPPDFSASKNAH